MFAGKSTQQTIQVTIQRQQKVFSERKGELGDKKAHILRDFQHGEDK